MSRNHSLPMEEHAISLEDGQGETSARLQWRLERTETELKAGREENAHLLRKLRHLEERQRQTCAAALIEAEQLSRLKREFVNNMNHELRTPLYAIIGMATVGLGTADVAKSRRALSCILEASRQLSALVVDVLDFSALEAGRFALRPTRIDLAAAFEAAAKRASLQAAAKGLAFTHVQAGDLPSACVLDGHCLDEVLSHLLANAVKFTERGSVTFASKRDGGWLEFSVSDTGIGIAPEHVRCLFRPFEQADGSASRRFGGMGLGLALAHRRLEAMGGTLRVDSELGKGTCFEVRVPIGGLDQ